MSPTESSPVKLVRYETSGGWVRRIPSSFNCFIASRTFLCRTLRYALARDTAGFVWVALESGWLIKGPLPSATRSRKAANRKGRRPLLSIEPPRQAGGAGAARTPAGGLPPESGTPGRVGY